MIDTDLLYRILDSYGIDVFGYFMVFLRVGAAVALLPIFGDAVVPLRVKLALVLSITLFIGPMAEHVSFGQFNMLLAFLFEVAVGLSLGFAVRSIFWILQIAGAMISQSLTLAQPTSDSDGEPQTAIAEFIKYAGIAASLSIGSHVLMVHFIMQSFAAVSFANSAFKFPYEQMLALVSASFNASFVISAPFIIISLLLNFATGLVNRFMPTLMLSQILAPAILMIGLAFLYVILPIALETWIAENQNSANFFGNFPK